MPPGLMGEGVTCSTGARGGRCVSRFLALNFSLAAVGLLMGFSLMGVWRVWYPYNDLTTEIGLGKGVDRIL
jgi:hypothetical protein